jgi:Ca2+/H+ antiporter
MNWDQIIPAISLIAVLILVLPAFLRTNSKLKRFIKNLSIWAIIVIIVMVFLTLIFK